MVLLRDVAAGSGALAATRSRKAKTLSLAGLLGTIADPDELGLVVGFLTGEPRQGRFGIGWSTLQALGLGSLDVAAAPAPDLTVRTVDETLDEIARITGAGSTARRRALLGTLFTRATPDEQRFLIALLTGRSSRCTPWTWWCWPPNGATAGAVAGCPTCTWARGTPTAGRR